MSESKAPTQANSAESAETFAAELAQRLRAYGDRPCIEFEHRWYTGNEVNRYADEVAAMLRDMGAQRSSTIGIVVRNRIVHAATVFACIVHRYPVAMINSYQSVGSIARDVTGLRPAVVIADPQDWTDSLRSACADSGIGAIVLAKESPQVVSPVRRCAGSGGTSDAVAGLHILTSGTTGPPKRVAIGVGALRHTVRTMTGGRTAALDDPPELVYWPFGSIGICQLLAGPFLGTPMVLLEKFSVDEWVRAVKTYRMRQAGVQPTILRMLLEANVAREDLSSLEYLFGGSGPLEQELRVEFERRYGTTLLWAYGATEFAGSVCAWTPETHRIYGAAKPNSVGRPLPEVDVRIVDPDTRERLAPGIQGILEARVQALGPDWTRTTDLASMDADGFVTIHGRADGAINRGGFKVLPETVRAVLLRHPAVRDACVVGVPDARLGHVPFAAVELREGWSAPPEAELKDLVRESLPSPHVPVAVAVVDGLPRNAALKPKVQDVVALYDSE